MSRSPLGFYRKGPECTVRSQPLLEATGQQGRSPRRRVTWSNVQSPAFTQVLGERRRGAGWPVAGEQMEGCSGLDVCWGCWGRARPLNGRQEAP